MSFHDDFFYLKGTTVVMIFEYQPNYKDIG